jgi:signal transduction histidine kinase
MVALCALVAELGLTAFVLEARFNLGFYTERLFAVISSTVLLGAMLAELAPVYERLLHTLWGVQRERDSRLLSLQAVGLAISHELNQPLAALSLESAAALQFIKQTPPDLVELRTSPKNIRDDALRAGQVLKNVRDLFSDKHLETQVIDPNEIIMDALTIMREELKVHDVVAETGLTPGLPSITGNKAQMLQVILNLLRNAVEALDGVTNRKRVVRIATEYCQDKIAIVVEDSGRGIDAEFADRIFDTFMTTKAAGMGLGLSLCRMIIERHGGSIVASPAIGQGARFDIVLPAARETGLPTGEQPIESRERVRFKTLDLRPI